MKTFKTVMMTTLFSLPILISFGQGCSQNFQMQEADVSGSLTLASQAATPPNLTEQPLSQAVLEGGSVQFSAKATGYPLPTYQWFKDGQMLVGAVNPTLEIKNVLEAQAGSYSVQVRNMEGSQLSQLAVLTVNTVPQIVTQPLSAGILVGGNFRFFVTTKGTAPLTYQWFFNGNPIAGAVADSYTVAQAGEGHSGNYSVTVRNAFGSVTSQLAALTVTQPPVAFVAATVMPATQNRSVLLNSAITFTVTAQGTAPISYKWMKDNVVLASTTNSFTIGSAKETDAGVYTLMASNNSAGQVFSAVATVNLTVEIPPSIVQQPMAQSVLDTSNVSFSVIAAGTAPLTYQWQKNGVNLANETKSVLALNNAQVGQSGMYRVVVKNAFGEVSSNAVPLTVTALPPTFANALPILQAKCMNCHMAGGVAAFANFNFQTEAQFLATEWFKAGDIMSPAIQRMQGSGGANATMPRGGIPWSLGEYNLIKNWILNAKPPAPVVAKYDPSFSCLTPSVPTASSVQRLAKVHYVNALLDFMSKLPASSQQTLLADLQTQLDLWPEDSDPTFTRRDGRVSQSHVDTMINVAMSLASSLVSNTSHINSLVSVCGAGSTKASLGTATCLQTFINYYGRKSLRRPLTTTEVAAHTSFYNSLTGDDRIVALLARFLAHPQFLYRIDNEGTLLSGTAGVDATYDLTKHELLSKMTFLYWSAPPDDSLYTLVATLDLKQAAQMDQVLDAILADPRAKKGVLNFYYEWLKLGSTPVFDNTSKSFLAFASGENLNVSGHQHRQDMINEVLDMAQFYTFTTAGRYDDLLKSPYSFAKSQDLAKLYGVPVWDGSATNLISFPAIHQRSGLMTRAAMLASSSEYTKPILKGKKIRVQMLCDDIPPPPPSLNIQPLVQDAVSTTAEVVTRTTASATCMACHSKMNPLGFATENFDSLGRARINEWKFDMNGALVNQLPVNTKVSPVLFPDDNKEVLNATELAYHIVDSGKGQQCLVKQFFRYSHDRSEDLNSDGCALEGMRTQLMASGGSLLKMIKETSKQVTFRQRKIK